MKTLKYFFYTLYFFMAVTKRMTFMKSLIVEYGNW